MKPFLVVNPQSAGGATQRHFDVIAQAVRNAVGECGHAFTERPLHAAELTRKALAEGHDLVIAVGGDGTINEVVNGFFDAPRFSEPSRPIKPGAALGVLPRGTGGDLRRSIGLDADLSRCAARLKGEKVAIDVGRVDFTTDESKPGSRYFINVAEVGVGAKVVDIANASSKVLGGKLTFMLASVRALIGWRDLPIRFSLDGGPFEETAVTTFAIANGRYFGGGMMVAPEAKLSDGLFHITIWRGFTLADFALKSGSMYDGSHIKLKGTQTRTARTVRLEAGGSDPVGVEVDGERIGRLPATFTVLPGALHLVM
ncbi:MAG: diacylglycerol kinase family protein [Myxococcales bacterium]|nr:diacylglycerol kinase family lipid kinase [Myxococcales bacterium]